MNHEEIYFDQSLRDYALKLCKDINDAEELFSQVFVKLYDNEKVNKRYFARSLKNQFISNQKKESRIVNDLPTLTSENERLEEKKRIQSILKRMHFYSRDILESIMDGDSCHQLHKLTGIPYATLREDMKNAQNKFKNLYKKIKIGLIVPGAKDDPKTGQKGYGGVTAVKYHRIFMPIAHLVQTYDIEFKLLYNGRDDEWIKEVDDCTHVLFNRDITTINVRRPSISLEVSQVLFHTLKQKNIKIICDIDDYWELPKHHRLSKFYKLTNVAQQHIHNVKNADIVWCTTKQLASKCLEYNKNVHVVRNALWDAQYANAETSIDFDTFYYVGGNTHKKDLRLLRNLMDDYRFNMMTSQEVEYKKWFKNASYLAHKPIDKYAEIYKTAGIVLVPLIENEFNRCKSELKMIEAGHFGKPVLVSKVEPYTNLASSKNSIQVANTPQDWAKALKKIHNNHQLQYDLGAQLQYDVHEHYNIARQNEIRLQTL